MRSANNLFLAFLLFPLIGISQEQTIGLFNNKSGVSEDGYTLIAPLFYNEVFLINNCGEYVHKWESVARPGSSTYLLANGNLLKSEWDSNGSFTLGGVGGYLRILNWDSDLLWEYKISDNIYAQHHDIAYLPNGNILVQVWCKKNETEILEAGRDDGVFSELLVTEEIWEIKPIGSNEAEIVWKWEVWDHLIQDRDSNKPNFGNIKSNPQKIDINYTENLANDRDWIHFNSIDYDEKNDLILLSARHFNEIWIIDHSTTMEQAASSTGGNYNKGGDLLFRYGNDESYDLENAQILFGQHDARWTNSDAGEIVIFNNGFNRSPNRSSVDKLVLNKNSENDFVFMEDGEFKTSSMTTLLERPNDPDFYSSITSGAQVFEETILVTTGFNGHCLEYNIETGENVWKYVNPVNGDGIASQGDDVVSPDPRLSNLLFKAIRYPLDYSGINTEQLILDPRPIENNFLNNSCNIDPLKLDGSANQLSVYPNPITNGLATIDGYTGNIKIINTLGQNINDFLINYSDNRAYINIRNLSNGIYYIQTDNNITLKVIKR